VIRNLFKGAGLLCLAALAGCAGATVSQETQNAPVNNAPPSQIVVYPFATNPNEVSLNSSLVQRAYRNISGADTSAEQAQIADEAAQNVCLEVVTALTQKGYNALCQKRGIAPGAGNILIVDGEFTNITEGNRLRRMVIGFGAGASVLDTNVYVNQLAPGGGQQQVLSFNTHADSGKMPGVAVTGPAGAAAGGAAAAATVGANVAMGGAKTYTSSTGYLGDKTAQQIVDALTKYFQQQGWPAGGAVASQG
jgi:hypothetical protein